VPAVPDLRRLCPVVYPLVRAVGQDDDRRANVENGLAVRNGDSKSVPFANVRAPSEHHVIHNYTAS
jgi:hypothetical protein